MNNEQEHKLEQRIRFVAKHYEEGRLDTDKAWQKFAGKHQVRHTVSFRRYWMAAASVLLLLIGFGTYFMTDRNSPEWVAVRPNRDKSWKCLHARLHMIRWLVILPSDMIKKLTERNGV